MIRQLRPNAGQSPKVLFFASVALACGLAACSPKEDSEKTDAWKLTVPTLELRTARGVTVKLKANELPSKNADAEVYSGDESALLRFAPQDREFSAVSEATCRSDLPIPQTHLEKFTTSYSVSFLRLVPPAMLSRSGMAKPWTCKFKLAVTNKKGSKSSGEISDLKFNFVNLGARFRSLDTGAARMLDEYAMARRLACANWWVDSASKESRETALSEMAKSELVNGKDSREFERQPTCGVIETFGLGEGAKTIFTGFYRPVFSAPPSAAPMITILNRDILVPASQNLTDFFRRPILLWSIRNTSRFTQTVFIPTSPENIKVTVLYGFKAPAGGWSRPARLLPKFTIAGALESLQTPNGIYFRFAPSTSVSLTMISDRPGSSSFMLFNKTETLLLALTVVSPLAVSTLANEHAISSLAAEDLATLEQAPRDPTTEEENILLPNLVLEPNFSSGMLQASSMKFSEAMRLGPQLTGTAGFYGQNLMASQLLE